MARRERYLVGLDVGTSKVTAIVGETTDDGRLDIISPGAGSRLALDGRRVLLNPGSVGQPRDGIPTASWMLLDTEAGVATWERTAYDVASVQAGMEQRGLPERLVTRLSYGL